MKILLLSDSHGRVSKIKQAMENEKFDQVVFCGDGLRDFDYIDDDSIIKVAGNCDWGNVCEAGEVIKDFDGIRCLITHGHLFKAKFGFGGLVKEAKLSNVPLVLFGHTHRQTDEEADGVRLVNAGSIANGQYCIIEILDGKITTNFMHL